MCVQVCVSMQVCVCVCVCVCVGVQLFDAARKAGPLNRVGLSRSEHVCHRYRKC